MQAPQMYIKEGTGFKLAPLQFAMTYYFFGRKYVSHTAHPLADSDEDSPERR